MGFVKAGEFHNCGYQFGRWYHMIWMEKFIGEYGDSQKSVVLIMKKGKLEYAGYASSLIAETKGKLWSYCTESESRAKEIEGKYKVTAKQFTEKGTRYKILSEQKPLIDAVPAEITLEDAYIFLNDKQDK